MGTSLAEDVKDLKFRLDWGQPAFTIIDVRDRLSFNQRHITGAISIPLQDLASRAKTALHQQRQIYVYGQDDSQSAQAVHILQNANFVQVGQLSGGVDAWAAVGGQIEGLVSC
jgi:rhodanese-related sulfurtransferase